MKSLFGFRKSKSKNSKPESSTIAAVDNSINTVNSTSTPSVAPSVSTAFSSNVARYPPVPHVYPDAGAVVLPSLPSAQPIAMTTKSFEIFRKDSNNLFCHINSKQDDNDKKNFVPASSVPIGISYSFFTNNTYSKQCALLAYNFHSSLYKIVYDHNVKQAGISEDWTCVSELSTQASSPKLPSAIPLASQFDTCDLKIIPITLLYVYFKYQVHHCDMALNLSTTLVYIERYLNTSIIPSQQSLLAKASSIPGEHDESGSDSDTDLTDLNFFNLVVTFSYLAHIWNDDVTIRLKDWYHEMGGLCRIPDVRTMSLILFNCFSVHLRFDLHANEKTVSKYVKTLCSLP